MANKIGVGLTISHINDVPITLETPVDVGCGGVQLREDGWLTVNPDAGYTGQLAFDCTVAGTADGADSKSHVIINVDVEREVIDLGSTGYTTFQELLDSGALVQAGEDVVITFNPDDPAGVHKITLKGVELLALSEPDFKFS